MPLNYGGPHGLLAAGSMDLRFFHRMGASLLDRKPLCGGIRTEAWIGTYGTVTGIKPEQIEASKLIVAWGNNVTWSNLHITPLINKARRAGGKLVVVDPRRTKIAEQADLHLALRPGTDVVLAWAVAADLERRGALDRAFIAAVGERLRGVHGAGAAVDDRARGRDVRAGGGRRGALRRVVRDHLAGVDHAWATGSSATATAAAASGRCSRCRRWPASSAPVGGGLVNGASFAFPKTPAEAGRGPTWCRPAPARSTSWTSAATSPSRR